MKTDNKIEKLKAERDSHLAKAQRHSETAKELDDKITNLENTSIIGMVRESGLAPAELAELISLLKDDPAKTINERTNGNEDK